MGNAADKQGFYCKICGDRSSGSGKYAIMRNRPRFVSFCSPDGTKLTTPFRFTKFGLESGFQAVSAPGRLKP